MVLRHLEKAGYQVQSECVEDAAQMRAALDRQTWDVIICDYRLPQFDAPGALAILQQTGQDIPLIVVSGTIGEVVAVEMMRSGAQDYLMKDNLTRLGPSVAREVKEAQQRESSRRAHEQLHLQSAALNAAANASLITNRSGIIQWVNPAWTTMTGYPADESIGQTPCQLKSGVQDDAFYDVLWKTILGGNVWQGELVNRRKDGTFYSEEETITPLLDGNGQVTHFICIKQDITKRKQADEKIREQAALIDQAQDAIVVCDMEDRIQFWNQGAERLFGWQASEALGRHSAELYGSNCHPESLAARKQLMEKGFWSGELHYNARDGRKLIVCCRWTLLRNELNEPKSILAFKTDLTAQKHIETQLLRSQRMEGLGTLAGGIAHDLNNILAPILMGTAILRNELKDEANCQLLDMMENSAQRGADIIKQLLVFGRGIDGDRSDLNLSHPIEEMAKIIHETFPKDLLLRIECDKDLLPISSTLTHLHQVLLNLCVNARDAMPEGGTLTLSAENIQIGPGQNLIPPEAKTGPYVLLKVRDTGIGMSSQVLDRVFDPFFTTKEVGKGTGLGLATVLGIVKGHNGYITIDSQEGQGTEFKIYFPAVTQHSSAKKHPMGNAQPRGHSELILIVDDEVAVREVLKKTLQYYGYQVITAEDGSRALDLCAARLQDIKVVITDLAMPSMDGLALVRALKTLAPWVPIIASTGLGQDLKLQELKALGVADILGKPYSSEVVLKALWGVLNDA